MNNTKLVFMTLLLAALGFSTLQAQIGIGVRAGINLASTVLEGDQQDIESIKNATILGPTVGLYLPLRITDDFAIQPEVSFIQKGGVRTYEKPAIGRSVEEKTRMNYLEIPVLAKYYFGNETRFFVEAGPFAGIALSGKKKFVVEDPSLEGPLESSADISFDNKNSDEYAKRVDYGANIGVGAVFGKVLVNLRYGLGINNLLDDDADNSNDTTPVMKTRGVTIAAGFEF